MLKSQQLCGGIPLRMPFSPERGFNYASPLRIVNRGDTILKNYQITLPLNEDTFDFSTTKSDGADIRFKDWQRKPLSYYIESWDRDAKTGSVTIKIDELGARSEGILWMLYGNENALSESSFDNTYIFGELWNEATLNAEKWTISNPAHLSYSINTVDHYIELVPAVTTSSIYFTGKSCTFPMEFLIEDGDSTDGFKYGWKAELRGKNWFRLLSPSIGIGGWHTVGTHSVFYYTSNYSIIENAQNYEFETTSSGWHISDWRFYRTSNTMYIERDGSIAQSASSSSPFDKMEIHLKTDYSSSKSTDIRLYSFRIRAYTATPPTIEFV